MRCYTLLTAVLGLSCSLAGCGSAPTRTLKVPVPVECRVVVPARPVMPTEQLAAAADLDQFVAAAMAEIELREGYEGELRSRLGACTTVIDQ
nr:hypothetical protein [uncultured Variovorax sp.]